MASLATISTPTRQLASLVSSTGSASVGAQRGPHYALLGEPYFPRLWEIGWINNRRTPTKLGQNSTGVDTSATTAVSASDAFLTQGAQGSGATLIGAPMRDEIAQLAKALEPSFTAPEDAELAATMMVMALRHELGQPATDADQLRYRAALKRLPKGSTATPRLVFVSPYDQKTDPHWRVTFTVGPTRYENSRRFGSVAAAETYVTDFLARLRGEINRP